jgi:ElaB/YqjD/DUF883 family membrane-anchored ribosome-binding protein
MPTENTNYGNAASDAAAKVSDKVSDVASQAKTKVSDLGRTAADKIDQNRDAAAGGLESAASTLHDKAENLPGGQKVTSLAHTAADKLTSTADYVRQHDVSSMMADIERLVKNNPGPSLLAAAVIGFLIGRTFSSND